MPVLEHSDYDWRYDIAAALEVYENAFLLKRKSSDGRLAELLPIPPMAVTATVERGEKRYEVWTQDGRVVLGPDMILHIRGQTVDGGPFGVSRIHQHRDPVGAMLAAQRFEGAYFRNHARPDVALIFPANVTQRQASEWRDVWNAEYGGPDNAGKALPLGGGATIEAIPLNMRDAQFVETRALGVEDVGRIMDVEPLLLGAGTAEQQDTQAMDRFLALQLPPRLARIARALWADPDLFAPNSDLYPAFDVDSLSFANPSARANVQHMQIQSGILLPDEARADNGRPPLPDGLGQIPQITPVGGAPNPDPATGSTDTQE
jgi:HK97 family phage portal protein